MSAKSGNGEILEAQDEQERVRARKPGNDEKCTRAMQGHLVKAADDLRLFFKIFPFLPRQFFVVQELGNAHAELHKLDGDRSLGRGAVAITAFCVLLLMPHGSTKTYRTPS